MATSSMDDAAQSLQADVEAQLEGGIATIETKVTTETYEENSNNAQDEGREDSFEENPRDPLASLDPPPSNAERLRDGLLKCLGGRVHSWLGVVVMILIIADGAFFFFLLVGAQRMCRPRTDCEPRNWWYNWSIQFLNVLFSYYATVTLPWRVANAFHLLGRSRPSNTGLDLYGIPTEEIWFHIRQRRRRWIVLLLVGNCLAQYANQATRIVYYNYELQNTFPGNVWTNVFFLASMLLAAIGGFWQLHEETLLRKANPERFPLGPIELGVQYLRVILRRKKDGEVGEDNERPLPEREEREKIRCLRRLHDWLVSNKTSLHMWAL